MKTKDQNVETLNLKKTLNTSTSLFFLNLFAMN